MTRDLQSVQKSKIQFSISSDLAARINVNKDKLALVHSMIAMAFVLMICKTIAGTLMNRNIQQKGIKYFDLSFPFPVNWCYSASSAILDEKFFSRAHRCNKP